MKPPTKCGRVHFEHSHRKWLVITVRPTTSVRKSPRKNLPPRNTPDSFCRLLHPTKSSLRCVGDIFLLWSLVGAEAPPSCWRKTALPLKSPTGAFIAAQPRHFAFRRNKKSEPFSYREKVRIFMVWCDGRDSNPRPTDS